MSQPSPNAADPLLGQVLGGHYFVEGMIARGGMGNIYRARHTRLGRAYAVKILRREFCVDGKVVKRFTREALAVSQLRHPHTVQVFDTGETDEGVHYIVMELLEGESLDRRIQGDGCLDAELAVRLVGQAAAALAEAHKKGIVHRDLKPANIFVVRPEGVPEFVKVLDFGIAKFYTGRGESKELTKLTAAGSTMGTPHYMAPEQIRGEDVDGRADIYSLGIILWECLVGRPPFGGDSPMEIFLGHLEQDLPSASAQAPAPMIVPHQIDAVIARAAARDPARRFQTMAEFKAALDSLLAAFDPTMLSQNLRMSQSLRVSQSMPLPSGPLDLAAAEAVRAVPTAPEGLASFRLGGQRSLVMVALAAVAVVVALGLWLFVLGGDDSAATARGGTPPPTAHVKLYSEPPGAQVMIDGEEVGKTPLRLDAPAGHRLEVELIGGASDEAVELDLTPIEGEILGAVVVLADTGSSGGGDVMTIWVESEPSGASILQGGRPTGYVTPVSLPVALGDGGAVEISLVRAGFVSERYRVFPRGGTSMVLTSILIPERSADERSRKR